MALWTYKIDALDINDHINFAVVEVPEVDDLPPGTNIMVQHAGDWPDFVRWQPESGLLSVNLFACQSLGGVMTNCTEAQWATRISALHTALSPGLHTFTARARGWATDRYVLAAPRSMGTNYRLRAISIELEVPKPVWTPV